MENIVGDVEKDEEMNFNCTEEVEDVEEMEEERVV